MMDDGDGDAAAADDDDGTQQATSITCRLREHHANATSHLS